MAPRKNHRSTGDIRGARFDCDCIASIVHGGYNCSKGRYHRLIFRMSVSDPDRLNVDWDFGGAMDHRNKAEAHWPSLSSP